MKIVRVVPLLLAATFIVCATLFAQDSRLGARDNTAASAEEARSIMRGTVPATPGSAMGSVINPQVYVVGPSDMFSIGIWVSPALVFPLTVTPEGTLVIPTVGEVPVAGMTLADAKTAIIKAARRKYLSANITASLATPRLVIVNVLGSVRHPGLYTLSASSRVDGAVAEAEKPVSAKEQTTDFNNPDRTQEMSTRSIVIRHNDGTVEHADLSKFQATKNDRWNPYLREGDVITVPYRDGERNVFGVYGEVNAPGRYEFVEGDSLSTAIGIAQGFTARALPDSIEFSRLSADGTNMTQRIVAMDGANAPDFPLEAGDRIMVRGKTDQREDFRVTVTGEVLHPGTYPITRNSSTLREVIHRAGGFTQAAFLPGAYVIRHSVAPEQLETERLYSLRGATTVDDSADFRLETALRLNTELVNVDFRRLFQSKDSTQDFNLRSEDTIVVPPAQHTVYTFGQVVVPGHIQVTSGKDAWYYIERAGGFTSRARKSDVRVIKGRTKQWLKPSETSVEAGDYVWVPSEPDRPFSYYMTIASQAASVLSVIIGVTVLIIQANK